MLLLAVMILLLNQRQTKKFLEGVKVSGDKNVVINATGSTITAQGEGTYVRTAMVISSTGDVVVNGGNFVAKMKK